MKRRSAVTFLPRRTSTTSSVGTKTCSISSCMPSCSTASLISSATFFSKLESTLTEYHRLAIVCAPLQWTTCRPLFQFHFKGLATQIPTEKGTHTESPRAVYVELGRVYPRNPVNSSTYAQNYVQTQLDNLIRRKEEQSGH